MLLSTTRLLNRISIQKKVLPTFQRALFSSEEISSLPRESMFYDVVVVGAGPAGLASAIRLKQLSQQHGKDLSVCVLEKGSEVGAHILSGNVFEPRAFNELFPDWQAMDNAPPLTTKAKEDAFLFLTSETSSFAMPHFLNLPTLNNEGNYIISLSQLMRWMAQQAEELGVEIYPGFAASEVLYDQEGSVRGVATRDMGIAKDGSMKDSFERGVELRARQTIFSEGSRGSCSEQVVEHFNLREGKDMQSYGIGLKEVWEVPEANVRPGFIQHSLGFPLQDSIWHNPYGGSFLYHMEPNLVLVGFVVGLNYKDPNITPYKEFQRFKIYLDIAKHLKGGKCISYGARVLNEGGLFAIPKLTFPGGVLAGCSAGFMNGAKVKGSHTAMKSGMVAAESIFENLTSQFEESVEEQGFILSNDMSAEAKAELLEDLPEEQRESMLQAHEPALETASYQTNIEQSWIWEELKLVRNMHGGFKWGLLPGLIHAGITQLFTRGMEPYDLRKPNPTSTDAEETVAQQDLETSAPYQYLKDPKTKDKFKQPLEYDGELTFDLLTNLQRAGTFHDHDQPSHLRIKPEKRHVPISESFEKYGGIEQKFCPAGVYEYVTNEDSKETELVINAQNCIHCKTCSIKSCQEFIDWTVPEGGGGPNYTVM
jgi:electron-transferring-flavoprotein dehydrogenase